MLFSLLLSLVYLILSIIIRNPIHLLLVVLGPILGLSSAILSHLLPHVLVYLGLYLLIFLAAHSLSLASVTINRLSHLVWAPSTPATHSLTLSLFRSLTLSQIPLTCASMNTARSFGPALISGTWEHHYVYWIGPLLGGAIGGFVHRYIFVNKELYNKAVALSSGAMGPTDVTTAI